MKIMLRLCHPANQQNSKKSDRNITRPVILLALFILSISHLVACGKTRDDSREMQFQETLGAQLDPHLKLLVSQPTYNSIDFVTIQILNQMDQVVYFPDRSMGVKAYQYDGTNSRWTPIDIRGQLADPGPLAVKPSSLTQDQYVDSFPVQHIEASGAIRLTVMGWTDPQNPANSMIATYQDIVIDKNNPQFIGAWNNTGINKEALPDQGKNYLIYEFVGPTIRISFSKGPRFGAAEVRVDGISRGFYCNYDEQNYGNNYVIIDDLSSAKHHLEIFPRVDEKCRPQSGPTEILKLDHN